MVSHIDTTDNSVPVGTQAVPPTAQHIPLVTRRADVPTSIHGIRRMLDFIEPRTRFETHETFEKSAAVEHVAGRLDLERERLRAQLVAADVHIRIGQFELGMSAVEAIRAWAMAHNDTYLLARCSRMTSLMAWRVGDSASALEAALPGVQLLGDDTPMAVRTEHQMALADSLASCGLYDAALDEYDVVIAQCEAHDNEELRTTAYNNMAYFFIQAGELTSALAMARKVEEYEATSSRPLPAAWEETVAQVLLATGDYEGVLSRLEKLCTSRTVDYHQQMAVAEAHLTSAQALRHLGRTAEAAKRLAICENLIESTCYNALRVGALREKAELAALSEDFALAYRLEKEAFAETFNARTRQRETQARSLALLAGADDAQAESLRYRQLSLLDPLTGLGNRRFVNDTLQGRIDHAAVHGSGVAVGIVDLDHFKRINDTCGHAVGDDVLQIVATILRDGMRPQAEGCAVEDIVDLSVEHAAPYAARLGGEEFLLVVPCSVAHEARELMESALKRLREYSWKGAASGLVVTASIGLVWTDQAVKASAVLKQADDLLYRAKESGRDKIVGPVPAPR